jgi:hypothetical protein
MNRLPQDGHTGSCGLSNVLASRRRGYGENNGFHIDPKLDGRLRDSTGIRRRLERDGLGREAWWWFASAYLNGRQRTRRWSVDNYCDRGAWRLAMSQRQEWEKSM